MEVPLDDVVTPPIAAPGRRRGGRAPIAAAIAVIAAIAVAVAVVTLSRRGDDADEPARPSPTTAVGPTTQLFAFDFDGDRGNCFRVGGDVEGAVVATGCASGEVLRTGRPLVAVTGPSRWTMVTSSAPSGAGGLASCLAEITAPAVVDPVVCSPRPLVGVLPTTTWGAVEWSLRDAGGRQVQLELLSSHGDVLLFAVPDSACHVVASWRDGGAWAEWCAKRATPALTIVGGRPAFVTRTSVEALDDGDVERLGCPDLDALLRLADQGGVTTDLRCDGDRAVVVQASALLESGRAEAVELRLQHTANGWIVVH